jgi:hypothetical protein
MPKSKITHPFYPIIYVRGYVMTQNEIDATVSTPYMGFNLGATKVRQDWQGKVIRHIFESPLVRLMKDYKYRDIYAEGKEMQGSIPAESIIIHRYYEQGDSDLGTGKAPSINEAAEELDKLILKVRNQVCGHDKEAKEAFKVYLVAHSMGGLVCRCFLQNPSVGTQESKELVDKVFTYATPHNGIEMAGINVPLFLGIWDMNNFNRRKMVEYLGLPSDSERVDTLNKKFDTKRFFCLVGTNHRDYQVAAGMSRRLAGEMSDGLVRIENATVYSAPRAFVYRSHSGPFGIVNSEEGYQNLVLFLFGNFKMLGTLYMEKPPLPPSVKRVVKRKKQKEPKKGKVRASYYIEATVAPRGAMTCKLSERRQETFSAVFRDYDELVKLDSPRFPVLFSVFLDTRHNPKGSRSLVFSVDLAVSATGYEIDGFLFDKHIPGEYLFRNTLTIRATSSDTGWDIRYSFMDDNWGESTRDVVKQDDKGLYIPLTSPKGFKGKLRLEAETWNRKRDNS